ncbi:MAG: PLP-dependent aminotransferase family protein [Cyanobacteria bacterium P01_C01_bin.121]
MELPFTLDLRPDTGVALHRQVYEKIRTAILTGRVRSQQKLPATRQLAQSLCVSRTTITQSYDQLISEGYLETRPGAGTFVSPQIPDHLLSSPVHSAVPESPVRDPIGEHCVSAFAKRLYSTANPSQSDQHSLSFRYWRPDLSLFPIKQWQRIVNRHSLANTEWMAYSTDPMGHEPLREAIAQYIFQSRAVSCQPEQILITQGTQQALGLIAQVLLNEGDAIALENPGYLSARKVFCSYGAVPIPIPFDAAGLNVAALEKASSRHPPPKLVYVTPSHQFPTGVLMSLSRRLALLEWAQQTGGLIVEDDYDSEFRYSGRPIPALQGLDSNGRVLYVGTFSKVMFPGLRLGYIVLPPALVPVFQRAKWICDRQSCILHQAALATFLSEGYLARHIRRMRMTYAQRRECLVAALQTLGPVEILGDPAGLHVMVRLPLSSKRSSKMVSAGDLVKQAASRGVGLFEVAPYYDDSRANDVTANDVALCAQEQKNRAREFIFGFGGLGEAAIEDAIARIKPLFVHLRSMVPGRE